MNKLSISTLIKLAFVIVSCTSCASVKQTDYTYATTFKQLVQCTDRYSYERTKYEPNYLLGTRDFEYDFNCGDEKYKCTIHRVSMFHTYTCTNLKTNKVVSTDGLF